MNLHSTSGFSLLEIVVAIIILGLVITGIFGLFTSAHELIGNAGQRLQATNYAQMVLEQLKLYVSAYRYLPYGAGNHAGTEVTCVLYDDPIDPAPSVHNFGEIGIAEPPITLADGTEFLGEYRVFNLSQFPEVNTNGQGVEVRIRYNKP